MGCKSWGPVKLFITTNSDYKQSLKYTVVVRQMVTEKATYNGVSIATI